MSLYQNAHPHPAGYREVNVADVTLPAPGLRLLPGPESCQFNLHIAVELFCHIQRAFCGVDIRTADNGDPVGVGFKTHAGKDFAGIGNFGISQDNLVRIECF